MMFAGLESMIARSTATGWWLCGIGMAGLFGMWRIYVMLRPKMEELKQKAEAAERDDKNNDINRLEARIIALESKVDQAETKADQAEAKVHAVEMKQVSTLAAFRLVASELQRHDPDNPVLRQAMDLIGLAATDDFGLGAGLGKLAQLPASRGKP
ncbi:hypothetical protein CA235_07535 [Sphingomonas sp. ABOLF]|uniref:hypothetical protein n=1 Tax=Sphingomonas sp. ABOLF TaxID=1985879 RepID=UPI000F7F5587|nr:hypothetical protein [Sphingomonas sp. ABOLF]RSV15695.1 hypothetical protein CA235_07535 [Sphingomonas sp. ABOLF]